MTVVTHSGPDLSRRCITIATITANAVYADAALRDHLLDAPREAGLPQ
jgi:hypothetical protein